MGWGQYLVKNNLNIWLVKVVEPAMSVDLTMCDFITSDETLASGGQENTLALM